MVAWKPAEPPAFPDSLDVKELTDTEDSTWQVINHPFRYHSALIGLITVPLGFVTDFASVPRIPLIFDELGDDANRPSVVHDWLYYADLVPKYMADKVLFEAMGVIGMAAWRRYPIYWGVVFGGQLAWDKHRQAGNKASDYL